MLVWIICFPKGSWVEYLISSWWHDLGRLRRSGFAEGSVSLEVGLEALKPRTIPSSLSLGFLLTIQYAILLAWCLLPHFLATVDIYPFGTISSNQRILLWVTLVMVFYHSNRKATKFTFNNVPSIKTYHYRCHIRCMHFWTIFRGWKSKGFYPRVILPVRWSIGLDPKAILI